MIFKSKRSEKALNFAMDVDPGDKYIEKFRDFIQLFIMCSNNVILKISFILKNANGILVSFNGQSISSRITIKDF